jgi:hypothetical protein
MILQESPHRAGVVRRSNELRHKVGYALVIQEFRAKRPIDRVVEVGATFAERNQPVAERHRAIQPPGWEAGERIVQTKIVEDPIHAAP